VTRAVVDALAGDYEVEPGDGGLRNSKLTNIETFLISGNQPRMKVCYA